ncbi:MAG: MFS transporter, partial [Tissierellales bacterium]|nr:MFS transporter [Tissierellales bacterium]
MDRRTNRNFRIFTTGRMVSLLGSGIQNIAIPLYILRTTGSGLMMGTYVLVQILPQIFLMPISGVLGDHFNRKKIMVVTDLLSGMVSLGLAAAMVMGELSLTVIFVAQIVLSSLLCLFEAATSAMIPEILDKDELLKGNSILGSVDSMAYIAGPILGASLFGLFGLQLVFFIDGLSFVFSACSELLIHYVPQNKSTSKLN